MVRNTSVTSLKSEINLGNPFIDYVFVQQWSDNGEKTNTEYVLLRTDNDKGLHCNFVNLRRIDNLEKDLG
jgi:hypothetical protein